MMMIKWWHKLLFFICWLLAVVRFVAWWSYKKKLSANIANCRKITVPPSFAKPHCRHVASLGSLDCAVAKCIHFNVLKSWKNVLCPFLNKRTISGCFEFEFELIACQNKCPKDNILIVSVPGAWCEITPGCGRLVCQCARQLKPWGGV